jgi:hypothetical protein
MTAISDGNMKVNGVHNNSPQGMLGNEFRTIESHALGVGLLHSEGQGWTKTARKINIMILKFNII